MVKVRGIVGIEVEITRLVGKWKLSQNRTPEDQLGVIAGAFLWAWCALRQ
jgi:transcriptional regulator